MYRSLYHVLHFAYAPVGLFHFWRYSLPIRRRYDQRYGRHAMRLSYPHWQIRLLTDLCLATRYDRHCPRRAFIFFKAWLRAILVTQNQCYIPTLTYVGWSRSASRVRAKSFCERG